MISAFVVSLVELPSWWPNRESLLAECGLLDDKKPVDYIFEQRIHIMDTYSKIPMHPMLQQGHWPEVRQWVTTHQELCGLVSGAVKCSSWFDSASSLLLTRHTHKLLQTVPVV
jgi:hypothetical protein